MKYLSHVRKENFLVDCSVSNSLYEGVLKVLGIYNICANDYAERAYGIVHRKHRYNQETVFIILSVIRYHLWSIRCMKTFGKDNQSIDQTIRKILGKLCLLR
ncbi:hypothetical protein XELAEV_18003662mg [Xenopus laevis]|uniref:Uncharacterized protein n=1 Tax=Xenopus laevis TaxID=8355 RepID=A0A974GYG4_XENLA|nr:hypothetical protein XELAEV_18003662mg [Xenopus laevis]